MHRLFTRLLAMALVMALPMTASAQGRPRPPHRDLRLTGPEHYIGLRLGMNFATVNSNKIDMDFNSRTGLSLGAVYGIQLASSYPIFLEPGLFYAEKGGIKTENGQEIKCRLSYLQIPIVLKYSFDVYDDLYVQPYLGGYLALGVGGSVKDYATRTSKSSYDYVNRPDGGLRVGCGVQYQIVYAELGFDFGIANISKDDFETVRNQAFYLNVGVNF